MVIKSLSILVFLTTSVYASFGNLVIKKGSVDVRSKDMSLTTFDKTVKLRELDYFKTSQASIAGLELNNQLTMLLGESTNAMINHPDKTGWKSIYLIEGAVRVFSEDASYLVQTPTTEVVTFKGVTDIYCHQGVTLIIPHSGQGAMVYCSTAVDGVEIENMGHVNQKGAFEVINDYGAFFKYVKGEDLTLEYKQIKALQKNTRAELYERLNIGYKEPIPVEIPVYVRDLLVEQLYFDTELIALESSMRVYDHYDQQASILRKGSSILFGQRLFASENNTQLIPEDLYKYFEQGVITEVFKEKLALANEALEQLTPIQRNFVIHFFRQQIVSKCKPQHHLKNGFKASFREIFVYNSNVTNTPDDQVSVSDKDDVSSNTNLTLRYNTRPWNWGVGSAVFQYTDQGYFKKIFQTREFNNYSIKLQNNLSFKKKAKISSFTPSLEYKIDYLNTANGKYRAFDTLKLDLQTVLKPLKNWSRYSDLGIVFISLGAEDRAYKGDASLRFDFNNLKKDTLTPFATLFFMSMKGFDSHKGKFSSVLNYRQSISDSNELDYGSLRLDLSYGIILDTWTVTPSLAYSNRAQSNYVGSKRNDDTFEYGCSFKRQVFKKSSDINLGYKFIEQNSNLNNFVYDNHQVSLTFNHAF